LALIALALVFGLLGAIADRVRPPQGTALMATAISDPMGLATPDLLRGPVDLAAGDGGLLALLNLGAAPAH
jgi:hypothetical protein